MPPIARQWNSLGYLRTTAAADRRKLRTTPFGELASRPPVSVEEYEHRGETIVRATAVDVAKDEAVVLVRAASISGNHYSYTHYAVVALRSGRWAWAAKEHYETLERLAERIEAARPLARVPRRAFPGYTYAGRKAGFGCGVID